MAGELNANVKSVRELETETAKYFQTFERSLFSGSGASKEFNNLALNIRNNLEKLGKSAEVSGKAADIIEDPAELEKIKQFLGFRKTQQVEVTRILSFQEKQIENQALRNEQEKKVAKELQNEIDARIAVTAKERLTNLNDSQKLVLKNLKLDKESLKINVPYVIFGKCNWFNGVFSMPHPEMELMEEHEKSRRRATRAPRIRGPRKCPL